MGWEGSLHPRPRTQLTFASSHLLLNSTAIFSHPIFYSSRFFLFAPLPVPDPLSRRLLPSRPSFDGPEIPRFRIYLVHNPPAAPLHTDRKPPLTVSELLRCSFFRLRLLPSFLEPLSAYPSLYSTVPDPPQPRISLVSINLLCNPKTASPLASAGPSPSRKGLVPSSPSALTLSAPAQPQSLFQVQQHRPKQCSSLLRQLLRHLLARCSHQLPARLRLCAHDRHARAQDPALGPTFGRRQRIRAGAYAGQRCGCEQFFTAIIRAFLPQSSAFSHPPSS